MASVKICDGRTVVYQYDTGVSIELCDCRDFTECHFAVNDGIIRRVVEGNICSVPDAALVNAGTLTVYAFSRNDDGGQTQHTFFIHVMARPKPADYIDPPDEADYIDLIAERAAKVLPLFIVHTEWVDGVLRADKLPWEIDAAADKGHACVMVYASNTLAYCGRKEKHPAFIGQPVKKTNGMFYVDVAYVLDDGTVDITPSSYIAAMTVKPLVFKGAVNATFTGTETTYVTIPDGGVSQEEIDEAVDKALTEAKDSGEFDGAPGEDGYTPVKGVDYFDGAPGEPGKDGTSVTITSITQSTEDDGYSVVTFSDGKQLKVKNGSKGSPGSGGSGGSSDPEVVTVMCVPSDDFQSFTADKGFADIHMALAAGKLVQAYVHGLGAYAPIALFNDDMAMFGVTLAMEGNVIAVSLVMSADGTNILSALPIIDGSGEDEEETAKDTLVVTYEDQGSGSAMVTHSAEQVYAEYTAGRKVVLLIADGVLYHAEHISSDECRFVRYSFDADGGGTRSVAVLPNHGMVKFTNEAIPADRPNPHPLVINGVSYNGSERVEMDVSGGGELERIENITTDQEVTVFAVPVQEKKEFIAYCRVPATEAERDVQFNFGGSLSFGSKTSKTAESTFCIELRIIGGYFFVTLTSAPSIYYQVYHKSWYWTHYNNKEFKLTMPSGYSFPAGTTFTVYAR